MKLLSIKNKQNGSTLVIIVIAVVILLVVGAGVFVATGGLNKTTKASTSDGIKQLIDNAKAGKYDAKCTGADTTGPITVYISGSDKIRVDTTILGKPGHLIRNGDNAYLWADGSNKGSKLPFNKDSSTDDKYSAESFANDVNKYKLTCESTHLARSLFKVPDGITFTDLNSQIKSSSYQSN